MKVAAAAAGAGHGAGQWRPWSCLWVLLLEEMRAGRRVGLEKECGWWGEVTMGAALGWKGGKDQLPGVLGRECSDGLSAEDTGALQPWCLDRKSTRLNSSH